MRKNELTKTAVALTNTRNRETDYDALYDFYFGDTERNLTPHQDDVRERWLKSYGLWLRDEDPNDIVNVLVKDYHISESAAWRDYRNAIKLWSQHEDQLPKKIKRIQVRAMIKDTRKRAIEDGDYKLVAACERNLIAVDGLDKEDVDLPFDKLELLPAVNVLDGASRVFVDMLLKAALEGGNINLMGLSDKMGITLNEVSDRLASEMAEDAEYDLIEAIEEGDTDE
jgi:hypothetical protein